MLCNETILVNRDNLGGVAATLHCKCWSCEHCFPRNCRKLKWKARCGAPNTFLTLTVNPARYETPTEAAQDLKKGWAKLRRRMDGELGIKQLPFIAVFEKTKAGWPHLHILMRCKYVPQAWISRNMQELIGARVADIRFIRGPRQVHSYVAKYVGKMPVRFAGTVRYWCSRNYLPKAANDDRSTGLFGRRPDIIGKPLYAYAAGLAEFGMASTVWNGILYFGDRLGLVPPDHAGPRRSGAGSDRQARLPLPPQPLSLVS